MTQIRSMKYHEKKDVKVDGLKIKLVMGCVNLQQLPGIQSLETFFFLKVEDGFGVCIRLQKLSIQGKAPFCKNFFSDLVK